MDNKERIMECALDLFYAKGYDAVGVQEIAETAGITKPTLYYYFGSKYGLLKTLLDTKFTQLIAEMKNAARYDGDVPKTLYRMAGTLIDIANANRKMYMLMMALFIPQRRMRPTRQSSPGCRSFTVPLSVFLRRLRPSWGISGEAETVCHRVCGYSKPVHFDYVHGKPGGQRGNKESIG